MVAPLTDLMRSFQDIANNRQISDNDYVFVKHGRAQVEGKLSHKFTSIERNAKSVRLLMQELRARYGVRIGTSAFLPELYRFSGGGKQLKVGDLRRIFQVGEFMRLSQVAQAIRQSCGEGYDDALRPLSEHLQASRMVMVSDADARAAIVSRFGEKIASVVLAGRSDISLESLPKLFSSARQLGVRLNGQPARVQDAVVDFCRSGVKTRDALGDVLEQHFPKAGGRERDQRLVGMFNALPANGITLDQAIEFFNKANFFRNRQIMSDFQDSVGDKDVCHVLGLDDLCRDGAELTTSLRRRVEAQKDVLLAGARLIREAVDEVFRKAMGENAVKSSAFSRDSQFLASEFICAARFSDEDLLAFKDAVCERLRRETDYDFGRDYELNRVVREPAWTEEKKALFGGVMDWLHREFPGSELFFTDTGPMKTVLRVLNGDVAGLDREEHPLEFLKAVALTGELDVPYVKERLPVLLARFPDGNFTQADLCHVLYGSHVVAPDAAQGVSAAVRRFSRLSDQLVWGLVKTGLPAAADAEKKRQDEFKQLGMSDEEASDAARDEVMQESKYQSVIGDVMAAQSAGLTLEASVAHALDKHLAVHLPDFAVRPKITPFGMPTKELAEAQWVIDFARQGEGYGKHRRDAGRTSVTVKLSDRTVTETNGKAGLSPDELALLDSDKRMSKHEAILGALRELCSGNDRLYLHAVAAITQAGIVTYVASTCGVVAGADGLKEHAPLAYTIEKDGDGNVVIEAKTPEGRPTARLEARVVIHSDGSSDFTRLDITPLVREPAQQEAPAQELVQAAPAA